MPVEPSDFDPQQLWQSQTAEYDAMTLADIHLKARTFQAKVRGRNMREYIACVVVVLFFLPALFQHQSWLMQAAGAWTIAATAFVAWQLHRRGSAKATPEAGQGLVDFHRQELMRQRDTLRSVAVWYIGPFIPGLVLMMSGRWFQSHAPHRPIAFDHAMILTASVIVLLVWLAIWLLNQWGAERLQRRIDELDALRPGQ